MAKFLVHEILVLIIFFSIFLTAILYVTHGNFGADFKEFSENLREDKSSTGFLVIIIALTLASVAPIPAFLLVIASGYSISNYSLAVMTNYLGSLIGAALAFVIGKGLLRSILERHVISGSKLAEAMDRLIEERGLFFVAFLRLPYTPFSKTNYILSCTKVDFGTYMLGTAVGIVPAILGLTALGKGFQQEGLGAVPPWLGYCAFGLILACLSFVAFSANKMIKAELGGGEETAKLVA